MSVRQHLKTVSIIGLLLTLVLSTPCSAKDATDSDEKNVIKSYNKTGLQLYRRLKEESRNLVISPYSIGTAMSMALSGARGDTGNEMKKVLNQTIPRGRIDSANSNILEKMSRFQEGKDIELSTANALCLTPDAALVHQDYKALISTKYHAEIFRAQNVDPINAWISKKTHGKIDRILEKLSDNSVCVLLNAIYFKGLWAAQFDKKLTRPGTFYTMENKAVSVPMMHQTAKYSVAEHDDFMAVAMPYKVDSLVMVIVLPRERKGLSRVEHKLSAELVQSVLMSLESRKPSKVMMSLPRFRISFGASLIPAFQSAGIQLAFSPKKADFGGVTGQHNASGLIWIDQIQHKAFLEVNEEGSEAAASTAVEFATRSAPRVTRFQVDHPFLFLLVDKTANAILFMGRVNNPNHL